MKIASINELGARLRRAAKQQLCPECGAQMAEVDRVRDAEAVFVWYECRINNCNGQWLQKGSMLNFNKA